MSNLIRAAIDWLMDAQQRTLVTVIGSITLIAAVVGIIAYFLAQQK